MESNLGKSLLFDPDARILTGTGSPEGVVTAPPSNIYRDLNVTNGASVWIKRSGTAKTGWYPEVADTGWRNVKSLLTLPAAVTLDNLLTSGVYLRRMGMYCHFVIDDGLRASATVAITNILALPAGFGITGVPVFRNVPIYQRNSTTVAGYIEAQAWNANTLRMAITSTIVNNTGLHIMWKTDQAWPASLPGTDAGHF